MVNVGAVSGYFKVTSLTEGVISYLNPNSAVALPILKA